MKAIRAHAFGGPEVLKLDEIADPTPGPGEVLVDIKVVGLNPADTYMRAGGYAIQPDLPYIPCGDAAGVVSALGAGATRFAIGDRVAIGAALGGQMTGCSAEKAVRPENNLVALPDSVTFAQGACLGVPYATAHYGLFGRGGGVAGETVFIHGASGAVGTAAIQLAKRAGMTVIGSAGTSKGMDLVKAEGADHAVDHTKDGYIEEVRAHTGGGPDLILEMLANVNLAADLDVAAKFGRIVIIGSRGDITITPRMTMGKNLDVRGLVMFNAGDDGLRAIMDDLMAGLADGSLKPIVGVEMPLAEAAAAHKRVLEPGAMGKLVLTV